MARVATQWAVDQASYLRWIERRQSAPRAGRPPANGPQISVVMPVFNTPLAWLREAIASVASQDYQNWQLCIADDGSTDPRVVPELRRWEASDSRISIQLLHQNAGIAGASNAALQLADGDFIALMDHDDVIPSNALGAVATALVEFPHTKLVYTDSDHLDERGGRCAPFFKPDWNYARFLGQNFLNHLTVIRSGVLERIGGWREGYEGSQDYDLYLRVIEIVEADEIHHIPDILYHWRDSPNSKARADLAAAVRAARRAIGHHLERVGAVADVKGAAAIFNRIQRRLVDPPDTLQVLLFGDDATQLSAAEQRVEALEPGFPLSIQTHDLSLIDAGLGTFINEAIGADPCSTVLVMNADLVAETDAWLEDLVALAHVAGTGVVGASCSTKEGYVYALPRFRAKLPRLAVSPLNAHELGVTNASSGYIANLALDQNVDFVLPDVMAFRRAVFHDAGGFPEDLDGEAAAEALCVAAADRGYRNVWSPHVRFRLASDRQRIHTPPIGRSDSAHAGDGPARARLPEIFVHDLPDQELLEWDITSAE